ncbi:histidine kinase [Massilia forsythiae]|uniref:Histidine kinase n=1 Tax=Massilia forsythiae TaxID=2728020 RepID=A0A7Z2VXA9_9BURK|nr:histidine kinase [Massilia forsythiae]QJE00981.1 histidine kinase [Massilia forsythiae]
MTSLVPVPSWLRALALNFALWAVLCALAGITTYGDAAHYGDTRSYWRMTLGWWCGYAAMMVQSYLLYLVYEGRPAWLATPRRIGAGYLVYILLCWPSAMLGLALRRCIKLDRAPTPANAWAYWRAADKFEWFVVFVLLTMAFGAVAAILLWRRQRRQDGELAQARLSLERQRLAALRGQLEPHFMFNTLSAIGAMVRTDDKRLALDGLERLGDLLAYALASSERDWIDLRRELRFVQDYLDLQRLRFGARLAVRIEGGELLDDDIACPPMLLQPLVENALRHDLECHAGTSDVAIGFFRDGAQLLVRVSNRVHASAAPAAGLGIGLRGIRARLRLAYGDAASLATVREAGAFVAELRIPRTADA